MINRVLPLPAIPIQTTNPSSIAQIYTTRSNFRARAFLSFKSPRHLSFTAWLFSTTLDKSSSIPMLKKDQLSLLTMIYHARIVPAAMVFQHLSLMRNVTRSPCSPLMAVSSIDHNRNDFIVLVSDYHFAHYP